MHQVLMFKSKNYAAKVRLNKKKMMKLLYRLIGKNDLKQKNVMLGMYYSRCMRLKRLYGTIEGRCEGNKQ